MGAQQKAFGTQETYSATPMSISSTQTVGTTDMDSYIYSTDGTTYMDSIALSENVSNIYNLTNVTSTYATSNSSMPLNSTINPNPDLSLTNYDDMDYSMIKYPKDLKLLPTWEIAVKISVYVVIMVLAMAGNVLIVLVVARNKRMRTTTNFFIVNLAVADLLVTVFCTWVHVVNNLTEGWVLGEFFCKANSFAQVASLVASTFSLILIACDRFFGIVFAMKAHIIERKASYSIVIVWVCAIMVAAPLLKVRSCGSVTWSDHVEIWCGDEWPVQVTTDAVTGQTSISFPGRQAYYAVLTIVLYFIPITFMCIIYFFIIMTVWFAQSPGERIVAKEPQVQRRVKRKVVKMLVIILATFGVCWLPLQVSLLYTEFRPNKTEMLPDWYYSLEFFAYTIAFSNSALNPIIYAGFNENFRKGFRSLFRCYDRKLYAAISRVDSMYNSSTTMTKL